MDGNLVRHMILLNFSARDAVGRWFAPMIVTPQMNVEYVKRLKVTTVLGESEVALLGFAA
jgi:hypothetical protein